MERQRLQTQKKKKKKKWESALSHYNGNLQARDWQQDKKKCHSHHFTICHLVQALMKHCTNVVLLFTSLARAHTHTHLRLHFTQDSTILNVQLYMLLFFLSFYFEGVA